MVNHESALLGNSDESDVVYSRWKQGEYEFPYSPYNRRAHLEGLDFVGTDVLLGPRAAEAFREMWTGNVVATLGVLAANGFTFSAVNVVTYERVYHAV